MRAYEFILNEKRRKKRKARSVAGPYYGYYYGLGTTTDSGAEGGDGGGVEEGELIPWPKGTVKVDVSDVYDWYKLGQHISNLKGLGKHDFGKGPPQTVMAFGSEPLEHEYIKDLNKIGLKTYDIDEGLVESIINKIPPSTLWAEQEEDIRQELLKNPRLFENTKDFTDLKTFLDRFGSNDIEVGNNYVYSSVASIIPGRIMSLAYFGNAHRLVGIKNNQVFFDINGKIQSYPESGGVEGDLLKQVLLFPTVEDFSKFQMLLKLKFSDWILKTKILDENVTEGKMAELDMDLEDPEITDRQFEKMYGMTRKEARKLFSRTNMWDFPDFRDPDKPLHEQGVAESLDRPYSYHWEEGDFGDLNAYAQLSDNTVLDIEFEQINVDKSQWTVGFQRDGQIHKTGKGDEQRVFATVLSAIKEFIENKQPKEVFFSAEKSEVNPESRKRLYDRLVQKYATALGYRASQSETNWGTKYKFLRIREQDLTESLDFEAGDCPIFAIALHRLSKLPLMALVEYDEEMGSTVLIHAYVKLNDEWRVDASGETNVPHMLAKFPNNGAAQEVQISEKDLIKLGYGKNKCPALSEVLPHAKEVLQDIKQGNLIEFAPSPDFRDDDDRQHMPLLEFAEIIKLFLGSEYIMIDRKTPEQVSVKFDPKDRTSGHNGAVLYSIIGKKQNEYPTVNFQLIDYEQGPQVGRGRRAGTAILKTRTNALKVADIIYNTMGLPQQDRRVEENFADGKNPGRKGLAKRMGVPTKASVSRLRQIAKSSSGEKQRMAHWLANMKAGRKK